MVGLRTEIRAWNQDKCPRIHNCIAQRRGCSADIVELKQIRNLETALGDNMDSPKFHFPLPWTKPEVIGVNTKQKFPKQIFDCVVACITGWYSSKPECCHETKWFSSHLSILRSFLPQQHSTQRSFLSDSLRRARFALVFEDIFYSWCFCSPLEFYLCVAATCVWNLKTILTTLGNDIDKFFVW